MVPYWRSGMNYYGISLIQNMYTPSTTKIGGILYGDRPYAAYLLLKTFKITNDQAHNFRQTSELDIGDRTLPLVILFRNPCTIMFPPIPSRWAWGYQINNDIVLNYNIMYETGMVRQRNFEMNVYGTGSLGTLYTNVGGGFMARAGLFNPYFRDPGNQERGSYAGTKVRKTEILFPVKSGVRFVGYDATLEGGVFNRTSSYTIDPKAVTRFVY